MSTYYELFCEAKIDGVWTDIDFHIQRLGDDCFVHDHIVPLIDGNSAIGSVLQWEGLGERIPRDELSDGLKNKIKDPMCFSYGDTLASRNLELPELCGFLPKQVVYNIEAGDWDQIDEEPLDVEEYDKLDKEQKQAYVYYEYTEPYGRRDVLRRIKRAVEARIEAYNGLLWALPRWDETKKIQPSDVRIIIRAS